MAITRAGAGTINDIIVSTTPSIIIPLPHSTNNHQLFNAKFLTDINAAILIEESDFDIDLNLSSVMGPAQTGLDFK